MEIEEQHQIPQQVSSYQFKLVGDMTLQQFFQVAGGALVAILAYSSNLPSYIKWPLIIFSFLMGVALAFFPLEDRPLAKWIVLFIKAIYSPTLYVWKKMPANFSYFKTDSTVSSPTASVPIQDRQTVVTNAPRESVKLESEEIKFLNKVTSDFNSQTIQPTPSSKPIFPPLQQIVEAKKGSVVIPSAVKIGLEVREKPQIKPDISESGSSADEFKLTPSGGQTIQNSKSATFSLEAAPPSPPTKDNIIVGQVIDKEGNIVENAILEIRDSEGRPVRALRSNRLGHFMIVTPLANGEYQITVEKEGFFFDTINLKAEGKIIRPLAIWSKEKNGKEKTQTTKI